MVSILNYNLFKNVYACLYFEAILTLNFNLFFIIVIALKDFMIWCNYLLYLQILHWSLVSARKITSPAFLGIVQPCYANDTVKPEKPEQSGKPKAGLKLPHSVQTDQLISSRLWRITSAASGLPVRTLEWTLTGIFNSHIKDLQEHHLSWVQYYKDQITGWTLNPGQMTYEVLRSPAPLYLEKLTPPDYPSRHSSLRAGLLLGTEPLTIA